MKKTVTEADLSQDSRNRRKQRVAPKAFLRKHRGTKRGDLSPAAFRELLFETARAVGTWEDPE